MKKLQFFISLVLSLAVGISTLAIPAAFAQNTSNTLTSEIVAAPAATPQGCRRVISDGLAVRTSPGINAPMLTDRLGNGIYLPFDQIIGLTGDNPVRRDGTTWLQINYPEVGWVALQDAISGDIFIGTTSSTECNSGGGGGGGGSADAPRGCRRVIVDNLAVRRNPGLTSALVQDRFGRDVYLPFDRVIGLPGTTPVNRDGTTWLNIAHPFEGWVALSDPNTGRIFLGTTTATQCGLNGGGGGGEIPGYTITNTGATGCRGIINGNRYIRAYPGVNSTALTLSRVGDRVSLTGRKATGSDRFTWLEVSNPIPGYSRGWIAADDGPGTTFYLGDNCR
ncbi:hypothetical protein H6G20_22845 [Desertifilum sp. FACHB-1129]|uniref:SH3b domain-containing protein n=1 Tax=Desertifilum tharense IPPAS B-1220 TaxID=1781255 RepID=A0A1E5QJC3_9CYAN|nr:MULTISPECIES: hypothetical protein [Desertifilum]MDA0213130.1 hypothetical protein [Cyanobacteria bacterium FC1]MBD2314512.1 hypothetical protein [Desertifilum sp. FACHB-1129]MBD2321087.1 hypothetical protein [Desertifilum sp. FACHB-866]MBD2331604.1 hypothetical protein [Desertifilum sp. FACHB-868]OEJ74718.1 hypothetical protein BH720_13130 [Desertifilum tharense IPPAS B-1220]